MSKVAMEQELEALLTARQEQLKVQHNFFDLINFLSEKTENIVLSDKEIDSLIMSLFSDTEFFTGVLVSAEEYQLLIDSTQKICKKEVNFFLWERTFLNPDGSAKSFFVSWKGEPKNQTRG